ncbi:MAG: sodium-translocating pyrophosphatase, partial [Thermoplasmata archaeon]
MLNIFPLIIGLISLFFAAGIAAFIIKKPKGDKKMQEIANAIHKGAITFLNEEYKIIAAFIIIVTLALLAASHYTEMPWQTSIAFITGAIFSALAGNIGMRVATAANVRTAEAAKSSVRKGLLIAFSSGAVMGLVVVGLGILGITIFYLLFEKDAASILFGFGFGASSIALFARVGGGIYTKSADIGADLVGKVEEGIPEDDPRNPAVIADNVGDNVGDVAGMGADLFESYADSIISAITLALIAAVYSKGDIYPLVIAAIGIMASIAA